MIKIIKDNFKERDLLDVLSQCLYKPTNEKLEKLINDYLKSNNKEIYTYEDNSIILGIIGIETLGKIITIKHIAVSKKARFKGIGKSLINYLINNSNINKIKAETDDDAVEFYKKLGFEIECLGEKYQGCTRYLCTKIKNGRINELNK